MKDFGTFDTLTDEEDTLYNRLAAIAHKTERLDYEMNDAQQDIKMWRNKPYMVARIISVVATFMTLVQQFVFLPGFVITFIIFLVWLVLNFLRNSNKDFFLKMVETMGIENRNVLIREQKEIVGNRALEIEELKEEETKLKMRLDSIRRMRV